MRSRPSKPRGNPLAADLLAGIRAMQLAGNPEALAARAGLVPDPWQLVVLRSESQTLLINASRQAGKSLIVALVVVSVLLKPGRTVVIVAPSERQSKELYRKVLAFWRRLGRPIAHVVVNRTSLELANESRLLALPGSGDTIRGISAVDLLVADEASLVPDELYNAVAPMLAVSAGRLLAPSTPNKEGAKNWWYTLWHTPPADDPDIARVEAKATDCPRIPAAFLARERRRLGERVFAIEFMCAFDAGAVDALWTREVLASTRVGSAPHLVRIAVGVDPSISEGGGECGIVVAGVGADGHVYILEDCSLHAQPHVWAARARTAYRAWKADEIVAEANQGGQMVQETLEALAPDERGRWLAVRLVHASRGKHTRAQPVAARFREGRAHLAGVFPALEDQLISWVPGLPSPDRLDAMVWAVAGLVGDAAEEAPGVLLQGAATGWFAEGVF